jgi:hypothetical protein
MEMQYLSSAETVRSKEKQHRVVPEADWAAILAGTTEHRLHLFFAKGPRDAFEVAQMRTGDSRRQIT